MIEARSRQHCEQRVRAGVLEQGTVDLLTEMGLGERMKREGLIHDGVEIRFKGQGHRIDFKELTGRGITIYAQQEVVKDLIAARLEAGADTFFEAENVTVHDFDSTQPKIRFQDRGEPSEISCDFIAGCDGFHGVCRPSIESALTVFERVFPFAWLGILAAAAPSSDELIYCYHERGFALHSMRTPEITRLYLQCAPEEDLAHWPDAKIWEEFQSAARHARRAEAHRRPDPAERRDRDAKFRRRADAVWQALSGGGRGAHRASDGRKGIESRRGRRSGSCGRDRRILCLGSIERSIVIRRLVCGECGWWNAFRLWMTSMLHRIPGNDRFEERRQLADLDYLTSSRAAAQSFAENYVGLPMS